MKYYKARKDSYDWFNKSLVLKDELVTKKERDSKFRYVADFSFEVVEIPKTNIHIVEGRRFELTK